MLRIQIIEKHLETDKSLWHSQMSIFIKYIDSQLRELRIFVANVTHRSRELTVPQTVCIALRFFTTGTFM